MCCSTQQPSKRRLRRGGPRRSSSVSHNNALERPPYQTSGFFKRYFSASFSSAAVGATPEGSDRICAGQRFG
jgi:hypothetical protein